MVPLVCRQSPKRNRSEASRRAHSQNLRHAPEIPLLFPPNTPTHWRRATNTPESARTDCGPKRGPASAKQATHVALTADRPQRGAYLESTQQSQRGFVFHSSHGLKSNKRGSASASESFKVRMLIRMLVVPLVPAESETKSQRSRKACPFAKPGART